MKKIFAIALAVVMMMSVFAVSAFAAAGDTNMLLEIGDVFGTLVQSEIVDVVNGGEFTLTATLDSAALTSTNTTFIAVKTTAGNVEQKTALPDGTTVTVTSLELDGTKVGLDDSMTTSTAKNGTINGNDCVLLLFQMGEKNALTGDVPDSFKTVTVTFTVNNPEAAPEAAPEETPEAAPEASAPEASAPEAAPAPAPSTNNTPAASAPATGLALAVVPAVMALAAVAVSKKH